MKKTVVTSVVLVVVGIVIGAIIVSNLSGSVDLGFARGGEVKLGGPAPIPHQNPSAKALGDNFVAVARAVTPSVVAINVTSSGKDLEERMPKDRFHNFGPDFKLPEPEPSRGFGSGVIITPDGYIVTNNHVVEDAESNGIEVVMHDKIRYQAKLIGTDPSTDLAVIKIDARDLAVAALGNSDNAQVGEWVLAIGNPLGLTSTVTAGIISATGRNIGIIQGNYGIESFIQTDAAINPGNSGGALVNMNGEVIGINSAIATTNARYQGYGFAIPVNLLKSVATDLIKGGKVHRGYIGVVISTVDQTMGNALGLNEAKGVLIDDLSKGGAAEEAGLRRGDVILKIDGREVNEPNELQSYVAQHHPGDEVRLLLFRDGKHLELKLKLKSRADSQLAAANPQVDEGGEEESPATVSKSIPLDAVGMTVRNLTPEEKKNLNIEQGAVVADVKPYGESFNRFIQRSDVIVEADRKPVRSAVDLKKIFADRKPGDAVLLRLKRVGTQQTAFVAVQIPK
ncbi:MAG: Do family serine endopeptidase [Bacteroidota bacterium]